MSVLHALDLLLVGVSLLKFLFLLVACVSAQIPFLACCLWLLYIAGKQVPSPEPGSKGGGGKAEPREPQVGPVQH